MAAIADEKIAKLDFNQFSLLQTCDLHYHLVDVLIQGDTMVLGFAKEHFDKTVALLNRRSELALNDQS